MDEWLTTKRKFSDTVHAAVGEAIKILQSLLRVDDFATMQE